MFPTFRRAAVCASLALAVFSQRPLAAAESPGKIAFASKDRDLNSEIYVMNADGTGVERLTYHLGKDSGPVLSPDGTKVAFLSERTATALHPNAAEIFVIGADGAGLVQVTANGHRNQSLSWSPDGTQLAFHSAPWDGSSDGEIRRVAITGGEEPVVASPAVAGSTQWITVGGGERIVFWRRISGNQVRPFFCPPAGGTTTEDAGGYARQFNATGTLSVNSFLEPAETAAGYRGGIAIRNGANAQLVSSFVLPLRDAGEPRFSSDGQRIVFVGTRLGDDMVQDVYSVNVNGTGLARLTSTLTSEESVSCAPGFTTPVAPPIGNGRIAFVASFKLYTVNAAGWDVREVAADGVSNPTWSPDGSTLAFTHTYYNGSQNVDQLATVGGDGAGRADFPLPEQYARAVHPAWRTTGPGLFFSGVRQVIGDSPRHRFYEMETPGAYPFVGPPEKPDPGPGEGWEMELPTISFAGTTERLLFRIYENYFTMALQYKDVADDGFTSAVMVANSTAVPEGFQRSSLANPTWNRAGTQILYTRSDFWDFGGTSQYGIYRFDTATLATTKLTNFTGVELLHPVLGLACSLDDQRILYAHCGGLYLMNADGTSPALFAQNFASSTDLSEPAWGTSNAVTPADTAAPTVAFTSLTSGASTRLLSISGTAADAPAHASGAGLVWLEIKRLSDNRYWNPGSSAKWTTDPALTPAPVVDAESGGAAAKSWICNNAVSPGSLPEGVNLSSGAYAITAYAVDRVGNVSEPVTVQVNAYRPGTVQFEHAAYVVDEKTGVFDPAEIRVVRTNGSDGTITVDYATSSAGDGTETTAGLAAEDSDYLAAFGTLTFVAGETSKTIPLAVTDDDFVEGDEQLTVTLSAPSGDAGLGAGVATVTIADDDLADAGTFAFSVSEYLAKESDGAASIVITRTGSNARSVTLHFSVGGGADFLTDVSGPVTFGPGETSRTISIPLLDNSQQNDDRSVYVHLSSSILGLNTYARLTVLDDETIAARGSFAFDLPSYSLDLKGGTVTVTVTRTGGSQGEVSFYYGREFVSIDDAAPYFDFALSGEGMLTFGDGDLTPKTFTITGLNSGFTGDKTFRLTLKSATNSDVIVSSALVTIHGGIHVPPVDPPPSHGTGHYSPPNVEIGTKNKFATAKSKLKIKGSVGGNVTKVYYKVGKKGKYKPAKGTANWNFKAPLEPGKNTIYVKVVGPGGETIKKLIVFRE